MRYLRRWACGIPFLLLALPPAWAEGGSGVRRFQLTAISFGYEVRHERLLFNFHNPSSFSTATLVPHEFVQTYTVDNQWGIIRGRYSLLGLDMESEAGITPQKTNHASDVDTFYQPDGNVVASGTTGNASMRSYMFSQRAWLLDVKGTRIGGGYKYQRNRSDFQFGYSFETQTKPPSQNGRAAADSGNHQCAHSRVRRWVSAPLESLSRGAVHGRSVCLSRRGAVSVHAVAGEVPRPGHRVFICFLWRGASDSCGLSGRKSPS